VASSRSDRRNAESLHAFAITRAYVRTNFGLVSLHDLIERRRLDVALLDQNCLKRAHPKLYL